MSAPTNRGLSLAFKAVLCFVLAELIGGIGGYVTAGSIDPRDDLGLCEAVEDRRLPARALSAMGELCQLPQCGLLVAEPMSSKPDTITIESSGERTLAADSATATVVLEGDSAFSGSAAFKKAKEVSELVDALVGIGLDRDTISIRDVRIESSSIIGIKSSSARYTIQIREIPIDLLPTALATIASRKQADLRSLRWVFSNLASEKESLRQTVIGSSLKKANATATALGVSILGVSSFTESVDEPGQATERFGEDRVMARMKKSKSAPTEIGFSLMHSGRLRISTKTEFRVSAIAARAE